MKNNIISSLLKLLENIDKETITYYYRNIEELTEYVNKKMENRADINYLIGGHKIELMRTNHNNHANFMYNIFLSKDSRMLYETYLWAYNAYSKKISNIIRLYDYLLTNHYHFKKYSMNIQDKQVSSKEEQTYKNFLNSILASNLDLALQISNDFIQTDDDIKVFWEEVILPSLYEVGNKWENAQISVGGRTYCYFYLPESYG